MDTKQQFMTAKGRDALPVQHKPHWAKLNKGAYLGLYKGERGSKWLARAYVGEGRYEETTLGTDTEMEVGKAMTQALQWAEVLRRDVPAIRATMPAPRHRPRNAKVQVGFAEPQITVGQAMDDYVAWLKAEGKAWEPVASMLNNHIHGTGGAWKDKTPEAQATARDFAALPVAKVTPDAMRAWQGSLVRVSDDPEDVRRSKDAGNRILTAVKAGLNRASGGKTAEVCRAVKPFTGKGKGKARKVGKARDVVLNAEERRRLREVTADAAHFKTLHFHYMVRALMLTGARPPSGELALARVRDFSPELRQLHIEDSKTGARDVMLSSEGVAFFTERAKGKAPGDLLLPDPKGKAWTHWNMRHPMRKAVKRAKLPANTVAYTLRHTYISQSLLQQFPVARLADQCGTSIQYIQENYGKWIKAADVTAQLDKWVPAE